MVFKYTFLKTIVENTKSNNFRNSYRHQNQFINCHIFLLELAAVEINKRKF